MLDFAKKTIKIPRTGIMFNFFLVLSSIFIIGYIGSQKTIAKPANHLNKFIIEIDDNQYSETFADIRTKKQKYKGETIVVKGFVHKNKAYGKNNCLLARIFMYCCAADSEVVGYFFNWNNINNYKEGQWLKITGTIDYITIYEDTLKVTVTTPYIRATKVEGISPPEEQYVY